MLIVDNKELGVLQYRNVVPIPDFDVSNLEDDALLKLKDYLLSFRGVPDFREKVAADFGSRHD